MQVYWKKCSDFYSNKIVIDSPEYILKYSILKAKRFCFILYVIKYQIYFGRYYCKNDNILTIWGYCVRISCTSSIFIDKI